MLSEEGRAGMFRNLKEEVRRLASDPTVQEAYLRWLGTWDCLDELALEFDHSYRTLESDGRLLPSQALTLGRLDFALARLSEDKPALWYGTEALQAPEWSEVRKLAGEALSCLD